MFKLFEDETFLGQVGVTFTQRFTAAQRPSQQRHHGSRFARKFAREFTRAFPRESTSEFTREFAREDICEFTLANA